ncbi:MAG: hypothetical protein ACOYW7_08230 [Nitrospirota bacterium]
MNQIICRAIGERRLLELHYHGYPRIVEPHVYGKDHHGDDVVRCYQVYGGSESGEEVGWKLLKVREISSLHMIETTFSTRRWYQRNDTIIESILCQV